MVSDEIKINGNTNPNVELTLDDLKEEFGKFIKSLNL